MAKHLLQFDIYYIEGEGTINSITLPSKMYYSGGQNEILTPYLGYKFIQMGSRNEPPKYTMGEGLRLTDRNKVYNGFVSSAFADSNGNFASGSVVFVLNGTDISGFAMSFDAELGEYATLININGTDFTNSNNVFAVIFDAINTITIEIKQWSRPYVSAKVTAIYDTLKRSYTNEIVDGNSSLILLSRGNQDLEDNKSPQFGVLARYGSAEILDYDNVIADLCNTNSLFTGIRTQTILDGKIIDNQLVREISYRYGDRIVNINLYSQTELLNFIDIPPEYLYIRENVDLLSIVNDLMEISTLNGVPFAPLSLEMENYLSRINYPLLQLENKKLMEHWGDVCKACMGVVWENNDGLQVLGTYPA